MFPFDPKNPFPLMSHSDYNYEWAKEHSVQAEKYFGLETEVAEQQHEIDFKDFDTRQSQAWVGLPIQTLMTPYLELRMILNDLQLEDFSSIVDLGCAYGRLGFLIQKLKLNLKFLGYEVSQPRVLAAKTYFKKNGLSADVIELADLSSHNFKIPIADAYFIYDFGSEAQINFSLEQLKQISKDRKIKVVGRGRRTRHLVYQQHPWLSQVNPSLDFAQYSIFFS